MRAAQLPAAELVVRLHSSGRGAELVRAKHLRLWDDLVALRFLDASLGTLTPVAGQPGWSELTGVDAGAVRRAFSAMLRPFPQRATVIIAYPVAPVRRTTFEAMSGMVRVFSALFCAREYSFVLSRLEGGAPAGMNPARCFRRPQVIDLPLQAGKPQLQEPLWVWSW